MKPSAGGNARVVIVAIVVCAVMLLSAVAVRGGTPTSSRVSGAAQARVALRPSITPILVGEFPQVSANTVLHDWTTVPMTDAGLLAYDSQTQQMFVAAGGDVQVLSTVTDKVVAQISIPHGPMTAGAMTYASGQEELFVTWSNDPGNLTIINTTTDKFVTTIPMSNLYGSDTCFDYSHGIGTSGIAYDNETGEVWLVVTCGIAVISAANNSLVTTIPATTIADGGTGVTEETCLAYDSGVNGVYAVGWYGDVFSSPSLNATNPYKFDLPDIDYHGMSYGMQVQSEWNQDCMAYDGAKAEIFVANGPNAASEDNASFEAVIPDHGCAGNEPCVMSELPVGYLPGGIVYDGTAGAVLLVTNDSDHVTAIRDTTNEVTIPFTVNGVANDVEFDPQDNELFVTGQAGVSIIPLAPSTNLTPSRTGTDVGTTVSFNSTVLDLSGGPYTYHYTVSGLSAGCVLVNGPELNCTPTYPGAFNVSVQVTDTVGNSFSATSSNVVVYPVTVKLTASRTSVDIGEPLWMNATVANDSSPLTYAYTWPSGAGCSSTTGPSMVCVPTRANWTFIVHLNATDGLGNVWPAASAAVAVDPALVARLTVSNSTPLLGQTVAFVSNASGGVGPYSYNYTGFPPGCVSIDKPAVGCLPTQAAYYNVTVHVTDQNGGTASANVTVHVIFDFNVIVPTSTSAGSPFTIRVNTNETFSGGTAVVPAAGFGSFTYNYTGLPPGCASEDAASITCTPTQVGTYHITVSVHDQVGDHNSHTVVVNVVPAKSTPGVLGLSGDTGYLVIGAIVVIAAVVVGLFIIRSRRPKRGDAEELPASTDVPVRAEKTEPDPANR